MRFSSWNVHGLGRPWIVNWLRNKLRALNPQVLFIIETKVCSKKMEVIWSKCSFSSGINVDAIGNEGSLSLCWKDSTTISLRSYSHFYIDVNVHDPVKGEN